MQELDLAASVGSGRDPASTTVSISAGAKIDVTVFGNGTVYAGNRNDNINITGSDKIVDGSGNDTLTLGKGGPMIEHRAAGQDTIHIDSVGTYIIPRMINTSVLVPR